VEQRQRQEVKKRKELETKLFQDQQIRDKEKIKAVEVAAKLEEFERTLKDTEKYKLEQVQKQKEDREKNRKHITQVLDQMKEAPRTFAKTGIAIIKA